MNHPQPDHTRSSNCDLSVLVAPSSARPSSSSSRFSPAAITETAYQIEDGIRDHDPAKRRPGRDLHATLGPRAPWGPNAQHMQTDRDTRLQDMFGSCGLSGILHVQGFVNEFIAVQGRPWVTQSPLHWQTDTNQNLLD